MDTCCAAGYARSAVASQTSVTSVQNFFLMLVACVRQRASAHRPPRPGFVDASYLCTAAQNLVKLVEKINLTST
jgi:hypothetical protein